MGRELKRVPIDWDWPVGKTWDGYLNHLHVATTCPHCDGSGWSPDAKRLSDQWYGNALFRPEDRGSAPYAPEYPAIWNFAQRNVTNSPGYYGNGDAAIMREAQRLARMWNRQWCHHLNADDVAALVAAERLHDLTHTWTEGKGWQRNDPFVMPTPQQVNDWSMSGMGHDTINRHVCIRAEVKRLGLPEYCSHCEGEGDVWPSPAAKAASEAWEQTEPPTGDGYQIWETVSEGSPISPVFSTPEDLAKHMATTKWGADKGTTYETWLAFIRGPGWAPSLIGMAGGVQNGVEGIVSMQQSHSE